MTRTTIVTAFAATLAAAVGSLGANDAAAQEVTLRMHTFVPSVSGTFKNLQWWAEKVKADSKGRIEIKSFANMQLGGKADELYDQARKGFVDIVFTLPGYTAGRFLRSEVWELPFVGGKSPVVMGPAIWSTYDKWLSKDFPDTHVIVMHAPGPFALHNHRPVKTLADMKGLKVRASSRVIGDIFASVGATPVGIPGIEMAEQFQRKVIESVHSAWTIALPTKIIAMASSHTEVRINQAVLMVTMNKDSYAKLPPDLKKVIDANSGMPLATEFGKRWTKDDLPGINAAKKAGHEIYELSDADRTKWEEMSKPVMDAWVADMKAKGVDGAALIKDARAAVAKYSK